MDYEVVFALICALFVLISIPRDQVDIESRRRLNRGGATVMDYGVMNLGGAMILRIILAPCGDSQQTIVQCFALKEGDGSGPNEWLHEPFVVNEGISSGLFERVAGMISCELGVQLTGKLVVKESTFGIRDTGVCRILNLKIVEPYRVAHKRYWATGVITITGIDKIGRPFLRIPLCGCPNLNSYRLIERIVAEVGAPCIRFGNNCFFRNNQTGEFTPGFNGFCFEDISPCELDLRLDEIEQRVIRDRDLKLTLIAA